MSERPSFSRRPPPRPVGGRIRAMSAMLLVVAGMIWARSQRDAPPPPPALVQVTGDVPAPGWYPLSAPTVHAAVRAAGGDPTALPDFALEDGLSLEISGGEIRIEPSGRELVLDLPLAINRASSIALEALPGVGPGLAAAIVDERSAGGPFRDADDLQRVKGVGPSRAAAIAPFVRFDESGSSARVGASLTPSADEP